MSLQPEASGRLDLSDAPARLHKLLHTKSDLQTAAHGFSASPKHALKALKVRVKSEDKPQQQPNDTESPAAADFVQHRKGRTGTLTPRDHLMTDATPRSRNGQPPRGFDSTPRSYHLASHPSAPMAQLVESDLFGDFSPRKGIMEARASVPVASPRWQPAEATGSGPAPGAETAAPAQPQSKTGLKVTLKHHRLAMADAGKPVSHAISASWTAAEQPATPAAKPSPPAAQTEAGVPEVHTQPEPPLPADVPAASQKVCTSFMCHQSPAYAYMHLR